MQKAITRNPGLFGPRTFGQKLSTLIIAVPCLVLALTLVFGFLGIRQEIRRSELKKFHLEMETNARGLDELFERVAILPRSAAARQSALTPEAEPDDDTPEILRQVLKKAAPEQCSAFYVAFDAFDPVKNPKGYQGISLGSDAPTRLLYNYNTDLEPRSLWYRGTKQAWEKRRKLPAMPEKPLPMVSEPYLDRDATDLWVVSVTQPIESRKGEFIGVAGVDLDCDKLSLFVQRIILDESQNSPDGSGGLVAYLLSAEGRVIARSDHEMSSEASMKLRPEENQLLKGGLDSPEEGAELPGTSGRRLFWKTANSRWKIVLSVPESILNAKVMRIALLPATFGVLALVIMVGFVSFLSRAVTGPIPRLTRAAEAVEAGDYRAEDLDPITSRRDEFGQLARGFRRMVFEVSAREEQLRQVQKDLAARERHFRSLIENGSDLITVVERDGTIRYESPSIRRVLGYEPEELIGKARFDMVHPDDLPAVARGMEWLSAGGTMNQSVVYRFRHKSGEWRTLEATAANLLDDPSVEGMVINSRDVTERKQAEADLETLRRRTAEELEERVQLRTAELGQKNEELSAAKDATDAAMKQQEIFLSNVAHDLRTPLTIVIGYSEDLLRRARKKGVDAFVPDLNLIVNRGNDLLELINDLLNLSKSMNEKGLELDLARFDVEPMIRRRMEGIGTIAQKQGNSVEFRPRGDLGSMVADEVKVWRILMNLLANSCKFTNKGTIVLEADRQVDRLIFRITDTGKGMTEAQTARLFDRFVQVHESSGKMQAGVGLGLSICQLYCRSMGGTLTVESEVGRGTTFQVVLPAEVAPPVAPVASRPCPSLAESILGSSDDHPESSLVLVIDDDPSIRELMRRNLTEEGYRAETANSGEEGLRMARELLPSAIILDIVMPGIDGWAVLAALKTDARMASIPIIMASMLDEKERGLRMGADEYLPKPVSGDRLTQVLQRHLIEGPRPRLLVVEDDLETRNRIIQSLRDQGWLIDQAADAPEALAHLKHSAPDVILLDLMIPGQDGHDMIDDIKENTAWRTIPIIVITADDLDLEARTRLKGQVEKIFTKGLIGRDELIREIRSRIAQHRREVRRASEETAHV